MLPLLLTLLPVASATSGIVDATISELPLWKVSPFLASYSLVYSWAPDRLYGNETYKNDTLLRFARAHGLATARYPAGEASYWNWEDPSGVMGRSTLDPAFDPATDRAPADQWMSLSEYLDFCTAAGMTPLVGVNYNCHQHAWCPPTNASVARAVRQARYVVEERGFAGAMWYIGNEDQAPSHAGRWAAHAGALKAVDPTMKIFFNENAMTPKILKKFLKDVERAGGRPGLVDGAEFHGKWPYGGSPKGLGPGTYAEWLEEVPLVERKTRQTWRDKIAGLRAAAEEAGVPGLLLANNEYGLGKPANLVGFNRFTKGMVVTEFALEMYAAGYDVAAFWDNSDGGHADHDDQMLLASQEDYRFNPSAMGLGLLSAAANNATMLNLTTSNRRVHGFATRGGGTRRARTRAHGIEATAEATEATEATDTGDTGDVIIRVFLMNKMESEQHVRLQLPAGGKLGRGEAMVDTDDHWGTMRALDVKCTAATGACDLVLPAVSFSVFYSS
eukprot:g1296.t1